jgi:hypothetical protein
MLGCGKVRRVYVHPDDPALVVKVAWLSSKLRARTELGDANRVEWRTWNLVAGTSLEAWFVPCVSISDDCMELIQYRAAPVRAPPKDRPLWFRDVKKENWGFWRGRTRLLDYGHPSYLEKLESAVNDGWAK